MAEADASLCRVVIDVYRQALTEAIEEVDRRVSAAIVGCGKEAMAEASTQKRFTVFTRCLAQRVRGQR